MTRIDILVFDGFEALDALGPHEVLRHGGLDARLVTAGGPRPVVAEQGLSVHAHAPRPSPDWLIVSGGSWDARHEPGAAGAGLTAIIGDHARRHRERGGRLAAVCTGTMWLTDAGLVGARPATTHHSNWDELEALGVEVRRGERVVDDGDLVTAGGIANGLFLGLHLVERLAGPQTRARVEAELELPDDRQGSAV